MSLSKVFAAGSAALIAGCASLPILGGADAPHPACAVEPITVYFDPDSGVLPVSAQTLVRRAADAVDACEAEGGALNRIEVVAYPDRDATGAEADAEALRRAESVVLALVEAGLPPEKVVGLDYRQAGEHDATHIMRRHADIRLNMD